MANVLGGVVFTGYHVLIKFFKNANRENDWDREQYAWHEKNSIEGDLQGVIEELPYIASLGVDLLYLAPIFESQTTHGYDTVNYFNIAPHIAYESESESKALLRELIEEAHRLGIKVILDLVLNHASKRFDFKTIEKRWKPQTEPPQTYQERQWQRTFCFWKESDPHTVEFLIYIGKYWLTEFQVDGFRLDHAHGLSKEFWLKFIQEMRGIKNSVILLGEIWNDNIPGLGNIDLMHSYVEKGSECFTSLFHYEFYGALKLFLLEGKLSEEEFYEKAIAYPNTCVSENFQWTYFLENHDIPRFIDLCEGDISKLLQATALLLAQSGNMLFEYGQESSLMGEKGSRNFYESGRVEMKFPMHWSVQEQEFNRYFMHLIHLREEYQALKIGENRCIYAKNGVLHFQKRYQEKKVDVVLVQKGVYILKGYDLLTKTHVCELKEGIYYIVEEKE